MHNVKFYTLFLIVGIIFNSCSKDKYEAQIPTYISIDQFTLTTNYATEGTASDNITDAWVFINDDLVGVYELPCNFPVLKEGNVTVKVFAGIKDNGIAGDRKRYLFYEHHEEQLNLVKGETIKIDPQIVYKSNVTFKWMEDFENASLSFLYSIGSDTIFNKVSNDVKEGAFSGQVYLEPTMDFFEATSVGYPSLPRNGSNVYLEMDFKTNELLHVGLYIDGSQYGNVILNTTDTWKKIYINYTDLINEAPSGSDYKIFIGFQESANNPFSNDHPEFHLDNIKLVHF